ncbi:MAG: pyroglutamyl-peptidase I [Candidatus Thorarchaeota archaeon]|nr:pyroglutamyl-peptidase I [Candidatus Thorarchaeota archaeon]
MSSWRLVSFMPRLLLTGFEPFDGFKTNPSEELVNRMNGLTVGDWTIEGHVFPLDYALIGEELDSLFKNGDYKVIICTGQAERGSISVERVALNAVSTTRKDNAGNAPTSDVIDPTGPVGYFTSLEPTPIVSRLRKEGIPAFVSYHAGTYGCNFLIYSVMRRIVTAGLNTRATFIHVPPLPCQALEKENMGLPTLPLDTIVHAITLIVGLL